MYGGTELPLAECPDLDSESGNRTDKWQITERGKSYIQAKDAILETPQPVLLTLLLTLHKNCPIERYLTITIATLSLNQLRHLQWLISAIMKTLRKPSYVCPRGQLPSLAQLSPVCESKTNKSHRVQLAIMQRVRQSRGEAVIVYPGLCRDLEMRTQLNLLLIKNEYVIQILLRL